MNWLRIELESHVDDSYDLVFGENVAGILGDYLKSKGKQKVLLLSDTNVSKLYLQQMIDKLNGIHVDQYIIQAGEKSKNINTAISVVDKMLELGYNRDDYVVALGGGVVGDLAGFIASIYKRGIDYIQIPTSLLAMFDSSVGGKTGVNLACVKNIVGAFKQPKLVIVNKFYLKTLDKRELLSGYFEGLKHIILDSKDHYEYYKFKGELLFEDLNLLELDNLLPKNIGVKVKVVMEDEKEQGIRKNLNYGHTLGHAVESALDGEISHGLSVAIGIIYVNILSANIGILDPKIANQINEFVITKLNININLVKCLIFKDLYHKMLKDKKNKEKAINFVLLKNFGQMISYETDDYNLLEIAYMQLLNVLDK